jgi:hypothetical protein
VRPRRLDHAGLADAGLAGDERDGAGTAGRVPSRGGEHGELVLALQDPATHLRIVSRRSHATETYGKNSSAASTTASVARLSCRRVSVSTVIAQG